jgi:hypothetical protein
LDSSLDKFTPNNIVNFGEQISKLKRTSAVKIYFTSALQSSSIPDTSVWFFKKIFNNAPNSIPFDVWCYVDPDKIFVEDYAKGIPLNILLGSMFVPSISTKTIKGFVGKSKTIDSYITKIPVFSILVSNISVVDKN